MFHGKKRQLNAAKTSHQVLKLTIEISTSPKFTLSASNQKVIYLAVSFFEAKNPNKTLLKNAIILWNYHFLSDYYHSLESKEEKLFVLESISSGSVIYWKHINMHGLYDFDQKFIKSFKATMREMINIDVDLQKN